MRGSSAAPSDLHGRSEVFTTHESSADLARCFRRAYSWRTAPVLLVRSWDTRAVGARKPEKLVLACTHVDLNIRPVVYQYIENQTILKLYVGGVYRRAINVYNFQSPPWSKIEPPAKKADGSTSHPSIILWPSCVLSSMLRPTSPDARRGRAAVLQPGMMPRNRAAASIFLDGYLV